jgi:pilus assembly protein CpaF
LSELCGLGPLDRIWADPSVRAVIVNGPAAIHVERQGVLEPSPERFRDQAHLAELVGRLVRRPSSDAVLFRLRDGGEGMVIFPPAAPAGPVLVLRRGEPGNATFERLIAAGTLAASMADLLRIAARCRRRCSSSGPRAPARPRCWRP